VGAAAENDRGQAAASRDHLKSPKPSPFLPKQRLVARAHPL
jgi:hypothetical protein